MHNTSCSLARRQLDGRLDARLSDELATARRRRDGSIVRSIGIGVAPVLVRALVWARRAKAAHPGLLRSAHVVGAISAETAEEVGAVVMRPVSLVAVEGVVGVVPSPGVGVAAENRKWAIVIRTNRPFGFVSL